MRRLLFALLVLCGAAWGTACPTGYSNSFPITINPQSYLSGNLTNFPVPFTGGAAFAGTGSGGDSLSTGIDVKFCTAQTSGTLLNYELVSPTYNTTTGAGEWWVSIPTVSPTLYETIWVFVGKSSDSDQSNSAGVWSGFKYVSHSGTSASLTLTDSTGANTVTNHGTTAVAGQIQGGASFVSASSQYQDTGSPLNVSSVTIEAWVNPTTLPSSGCGSIVFLGSNGPTNGYSFYLCSGVLTMEIGNAGSASDYRATGTGLTTGSWQHVAASYNGGSGTSTASYALYWDGTAVSGSMVATGTATMGASSQNFLIGQRSSGSYLNGAADEVRVYNGVLTADWVAADYQIQANLASFYSLTLPPLTVIQPLVQSNSANAQSVVLSSVVTGDIEVCAASVNQSGGGTLTGISDSNAGAFASIDSCTNNGVTTADWVATSTATASHTITVTGNSTGVSLHCVALNPAATTATVDVHTCGGFATTPVHTASITPTVNGDVAFAFETSTSSAGYGWAYVPLQQLTNNFGNLSAVSGLQVLGIASAYTSWFHPANSLGNYVVATFKSVANITIKNSSLPTGTKNQSYWYPLYALGGAGAYTWSITSGTLFTGLSLNSQTGEISGTPTTGGTNAITFQVTDGTHTTTQALSLTIFSTAATPTLVQAVKNSSGPLTSVAIGDVIETCYYALSSQTGHALTPTTDSLGNVYSSLGSVYPYTAGGSTWLCSAVSSTFAGADTVTVPGSSYIILQFNNVQGFFDLVGLTHGFGSTATITSLPLVTNAPNSLLSAMGFMDSNSTMSVNAPFSLGVNNNGSPTYEGDYYVTPSATSTTSSYATTSNTGSWGIVMLDLWPSTSGVVNNNHRRAWVISK